MAEDNAHSLFSASAAHRWTRCYGSLTQAQGLVDKGSASADEGTAAHTLAEWCLTSDVSPDAEAFRGRRIEVGKRTFEVNSEMIAAVNKYVSHVLSLAEGHELLVEQKVSYGEHLGVANDLAFGTSDAVILRDDGEIIVVDLKYGANPNNRVDAEDNDQLRLYALGALSSFDGLLGDFDRARMVIVQPRLDHVSEWTQTVAELKTWALEAKMAAAHASAILARGEAKLIELNPGPKQCHWCKAKATCPGVVAEVVEAVKHDAATVDDFDDLTVKDKEVLRAYNTDALGSYMAKVDLIEAWCKAVRGEVEARLLEGKPVPGYKLVQGRQGARAWADAAEAETTLKSFRLKVEEMYDLSLISPTTAEKLSKAGTIGPRQWAKAQALITRSEGKPSVAPESDKRPPLVIAATADDFDVVADDADDLV